MSDLVFVSLEAWDGVWRRNQHLVAGLLRADPQLRVLFVEPPADPLHAALTGRRPQPGRRLRQASAESAQDVSGRLWLYEPTKWLPRRIDRRTDGRWAGAAQRAAERLAFDDPVLWVNSPQGAHLLDRTGWRAVYDITDDWLAADRPADELARLGREEALLLEQCAEVIVCSPHLARTKNHRELTLIPNAVDLEGYRRTYPRPDDLPDGHVVLYAGTTHTDRTDVQLVAATARAVRGVAHLVLVGPVLLDERGRQVLHDAGVITLGPKEHHQVPAYLQHARVLLVPHVVNAFTESLDPIKVYEYAASGRPVIGTPVAGFRDSEDPQVVTVDPREFTQAVLHQLEHPDQARPAGDPLPGLPTWQMRVSEVQSVLARLQR